MPSPEKKSPSSGNEGRPQYINDEVDRITGGMANIHIQQGVKTQGADFQDSPGGDPVPAGNKKKARMNARTRLKTRKNLAADMALAAPAGSDSPSTGISSYSGGQRTEKKSTRQKRSIADVGAAQKKPEKTGKSTNLGQPAVW